VTSLTPAIAGVGAELKRIAGGYLRNTVQVPSATCSVCAGPAPGYTYCYKCLRHSQSGYPIADRVATFVYAVKDPAGTEDQTYRAMRGYKAPKPQPAHLDLVESLVVLAIIGHLRCLKTLTGGKSLRWATVSGTHHTGEHPFHRLIAAHLPPGEVPLTLQPDRPHRRLDPQRYELNPNEDLSGEHVLVLDDSWVTGSTVQSAAIALKETGADTVSILALARILDKSYSPTTTFLKSASYPTSFKYQICPWTGGKCP
jgi:hypothetical protein